MYNEVHKFYSYSAKSVFLTIYTYLGSFYALMDTCHGMLCCDFSSHIITLYLFYLFDSFWIRCSKLSKRSNFICSPDFVFPYTLVLKYHADSIPSLSQILLISSRFLFVTSSVKWTWFLRFFLCFIITTFASAQENLVNLTNKEIDKNNQVHGHYISAKKL